MYWLVRSQEHALGMALLIVTSVPLSHGSELWATAVARLHPSNSFDTDLGLQSTFETYTQTSFPPQLKFQTWNWVWGRFMHSLHRSWCTLL
jgi:hypothetical protein